MRIHVLLLLFIFPTYTIHADELHLIISGKSFHINSTADWNENNYGLGFEYDFEPVNNWTPLVSGTSLKDSNNQTSNYLGGGVKYNIFNKNDFYVKLGGLAFLMTRYDYKNNQPFFSVLPFASIGYKRVSTNIAYVPKVTDTMDAAIYIQLLIQIM